MTSHYRTFISTLIAFAIVGMYIYMLYKIGVISIAFQTEMGVR